jgi:hypothetical protein
MEGVEQSWVVAEFLVELGGVVQVGPCLVLQQEGVEVVPGTSGLFGVLDQSLGGGGVSCTGLLGLLLGLR